MKHEFNSSGIHVMHTLTVSVFVEVVSMRKSDREQKHEKK